MAELHLYDVIKRPVVTEKSAIQSDDLNQYVFEVAPDSNKIQIKEAIEVIFDVDVVKVNTMVMPAKRGRRGRNSNPASDADRAGSEGNDAHGRCQGAHRLLCR